MSKKAKGREKAKLPVATVAYYGPDDKTPTKVAVGIVKEWGKEPVQLKRWWGEDVARDVAIQREIADFIATHGARSVVVTEGIIGCPHEEGIDFPLGQECPYCPFWRGKERHASVEVLRPGSLRPNRPTVLIAVATFTREQWEKLLQVATNRDELENSWEEWRDAKEKALIHLRELGFEPFEVSVDVDALQEYCRRRRIRNDSTARAEYATEKLRLDRQGSNFA